METRAPWAEPVLMTADELSGLPEDGWRYELVDGRLVRMSPTRSRHGRVTMALLAAVHRYVQEHHLGEVFPAETGFLISAPGEPDTVLAPDLAFVRAGREPDRAADEYPRLAPDLVAEVASASQGRTEMRAKAQRWLDAGVSLVWVVFPQLRAVEIWCRSGLERLAEAGADLTGEDILPGFALPVGDLFG